MGEKSTPRKMMLNKESVRVLTDPDLKQASGGRPPVSNFVCLWLTQACPPVFTEVGCYTDQCR